MLQHKLERGGADRHLWSSPKRGLHCETSLQGSKLTPATFWFNSAAWVQAAPSSLGHAACRVPAAVGKLGALAPTILYNYIDNQTNFWVVPGSDYLAFSLHGRSCVVSRLALVSRPPSRIQKPLVTKAAGSRPFRSVENVPAGYIYVQRHQITTERLP